MSASRLLSLLLALTICAAWASLARAERVVASLSSDRVLISSDFAGTDLVLFGAVEEDDAGGSPPRAYDVVVTVTGPRQNVVTRRKERVLGVWIDVDSRPFTDAPAYLAVLANRPLARVASADLIRRLRIGLARAWVSECEADPIRVVGPGLFGDPLPRASAPAKQPLVRIASSKPDDLPRGALADTILSECGADFGDSPGASACVADRPSGDPFRAAFLRLNSERGLYREETNGVTLLSPNLFRANITLPANVPVGRYAVEVQLFAEGTLLDVQPLSIEIAKVGFQQFAASFARDYGLLNGFATAGLALLIGWFASIMFRRE
jgi:hypothetical protein